VEDWGASCGEARKVGNLQHRPQAETDFGSQETEGLVCLDTCHGFRVSLAVDRELQQQVTGSRVGS
jgi:hypothetical protein